MKLRATPLLAAIALALGVSGTAIAQSSSGDSGGNTNAKTSRDASQLNPPLDPATANPARSTDSNIYNSGTNPSSYSSWPDANARAGFPADETVGGADNTNAKVNNVARTAYPLDESVGGADNTNARIHGGTADFVQTMP